MSARPLRPLLVATVAIVAVSALGCHDSSGPEQSDPAIFTWNGDLKPQGIIHLRNVNGSVQVRPSHDSAVHVLAGARWHRGDPKTDLKFSVINGDNDVTVCVIWGKGDCGEHNYTTGPSFLKFMRKGTDATVTLTVEVPARVRVDAFTANGSIDVAATAPVRAYDVNGSVRVATAIGPVDAVTVNGSVDVRMTTIGSDTGRVRAETVNGSAKAYVPAELDGDYTLKVTNGGITNDFGAFDGAAIARSKTQTGTLGHGGRDIIVKALNGGVGLYKLNADGTPMTKP
ncbi:MAG: hypothetical protein HYR75_09855 [Gemmatimonadetes bacterium]|nr:hypothetical protein [Gemmatimonadota bacterium]MBI3568521.1 hypothetical protein [Gemmatimonadota bacterium]